MTSREVAAEHLSTRAEASEHSPRCPTCKAALFYLPHGFAIRKGHVYSRAGKAELGITGMCEFCFDALADPDELAAEKGVIIDHDVPRELPLEGQVLQTVDLMTDNYGGADGRYATSDPDKAYVITSEIDGGPRRHRPVLDIDLPARLIPSTTPGHFHLYLDIEIPHEKYMRLLDALGEAGILEPGYVLASKARGYTAARLPWIKKMKSPAEMVYEAVDEIQMA